MKALSSTQVFYQDQLQPATVLIDQGLIVDVVIGKDMSQYQIPEHCLRVDHGDLVIMPGLVDSHVHINEPGRTEWEGFNSATQAAAPHSLQQHARSNSGLQTHGLQHHSLQHHS